jgi:hypothetical protein
MSRLVPRKYKVLKGINDILVLKLVGVSKNGIKGFLIRDINITIYIFGRIIVIVITNLKRATSRLVPIKRIKVGNYKY